MHVEPEPVTNELPARTHNRPDLVRDAKHGEESRPSRQDWRPTFRSRLMVLGVLVALWSVGIQARLVYLQVVDHDDLMQRAERQWSRTREVPPKRGDLVDRYGRVLAYSVDGHAIYAEPNLVSDPESTAKKVCAAIDGCTAQDRASMLERLRKPRAFQYLWRRAAPEDAARITALKLTGVGVLREQRRYYPNRELAAHVLGFASLDNIGLGGIESAYNSKISGRPGRVLLQTDAKAQAFGRVERPPTAGATLELTIDRDLQYIAERELAAGVKEFGAQGGTAIILEPSSGDVLALANWPTFNPNRFQDADARHQKNRAIQDIYEPGSTFKVVTASAALEEKLVRLDEPFDVSLGYIRFGSRQIEDSHRYPGALTFTDVIAKSSNVGAIKIGMRVGATRLVDYARRFGFGDAIARDLPGQSRGIVWDAARLNDSALASVSMGYQVGVTPIQMVSAVNVIANGGALVEPRLVRATVEGNRRTVRPSRVMRQVVSRTTADQLTAIMEEVVSRGTATAARIDGFTIAGKTGTAAKLVNGHYSKTDYNASFVGFVPSRQPAVTILVVLDSPHGKGFYGGSVAAPVFKRIADATLRYLGVPPNVDPAARLVVTRREAPMPGAFDARPARASLTNAPAAVFTSDVMPDLRGASAREAVHALAQLGVAAQLVGDGLVVEQDIAPGTPLERGGSCVIRLSRRPDAVAPARTNP